MILARACVFVLYQCKKKNIFSFQFRVLISYIFSSSGIAKVLVSNLPAQARLEDLDLLFANYGQVQNIEKLSSRDPNTQTLLVSYETQEQVQQ